MPNLRKPKNKPEDIITGLRVKISDDPMGRAAVECRKLIGEIEAAQYALKVDADGGLLRQGDVLTWKSNGQHPMKDAIAGLLTLGCITGKVAVATSTARARATQEFLAEYRRNPPQITAEQRAEARAAHGPGVKLINIVTGETWTT